MTLGCVPRGLSPSWRAGEGGGSRPHARACRQPHRASRWGRLRPTGTRGPRCLPAAAPARLKHPPGPAGERRGSSSRASLREPLAAPGLSLQRRFEPRVLLTTQSRGRSTLLCVRPVSRHPRGLCPAWPACAAFVALSVPRRGADVPAAAPSEGHVAQRPRHPRNTEAVAPPHPAEPPRLESKTRRSPLWAREADVAVMQAA